MGAHDGVKNSDTLGLESTPALDSYIPRQLYVVQTPTVGAVSIKVLYKISESSKRVDWMCDSLLILDQDGMVSANERWQSECRFLQ